MISQPIALQNLQVFINLYYCYSKYPLVDVILLDNRQLSLTPLYSWKNLKFKELYLPVPLTCREFCWVCGSPDPVLKESIFEWWRKIWNPNNSRMVSIFFVKNSALLIFFSSFTLFIRIYFLNGLPDTLENFPPSYEIRCLMLSQELFV